MVDTLVSKTRAAQACGSNPALGTPSYGGMAERVIATVLKTVVGAGTTYRGFESLSLRCQYINKHVKAI